jgi:anti-sigma factor RsiW
MKCTWVQEHLVLYLAGELAAPETAQILEHLEMCAECMAQAEALAETQARLEAAIHTTVEAPTTLEARVMEVVRALPAPQRPWFRVLPRWGWRPSLALASAALCLLGLGFVIGRWQALPSGGVHATTLNWASLDPEGNAETQLQSDPRQLSQALTSLVDFSVPVVDLKPEGAALVGGNRSVVQGVTVARLHYAWQGQPVALFVMDDKKLAPPMLPQAAFGSADSYLAGKAHGLTYVAWHTGRTNCVMVARSVPMHLLFRLACHACEKQERL